MGYTERDKVEGKINLKRQELSRKQIKQQLSKNGYGKYTPIEIDMITSKAFWSLNGSCKNLLLLILAKRRLKFKKGKTPVCINTDEIIMTWKELEAPPFNFHQEQIRRNFKTLLSRGFIKKVYQGGGFKKDKNIYGISDNWQMWEPDKDFSPKKKDVKRGYQGKGLGAVKTISTHKNVSHTRTQKCYSVILRLDPLNLASITISGALLLAAFLILRSIASVLTIRLSAVDREDVES